MTQVPIENLGAEFKRIIDAAGKHNAEVIAKTIKGMPYEFEDAAIQYYPLVLRVRSGHLKQQIEGFSRNIGAGVVEIGLQNDKEYARVQHDGFDGMVNVPSHSRTRAGNTHQVRAHTRHMRIKPKKFLERPMVIKANIILTEMMRKFGFGKSE